MKPYTFITKTVEYSDLFDGENKPPEEYLVGINKRWLIESVVYLISVDRFDCFSMKADRCLLMMFQDYLERVEVKQLFDRLKLLERRYSGIWLTFINHQALFRLLRKILLIPNEMEGMGECFHSYLALLQATLSENSYEMIREREVLSIIEPEKSSIKDAMIIMQQDMLSIDKFGENKVELEKSQLVKYLALCKFGRNNALVGDAIKRVVNK